MANQMDAMFKGHVGADPTLHIARSGTAIAVLRVAHTMSRRLPNGAYDDETQWFDVKCFGRLAEHVASCVAKGHPVLIRGRVVTETWETAEGEPRAKVVVIASDIGIDLTFGTATYRRATQKALPDAPAEHGAARATTAQPHAQKPAPAPRESHTEAAPNAPAPPPASTPPAVPTPQNRDALARNRFAQYAAFP